MSAVVWFNIPEPDNPMSINMAQIAYVVKQGAGCRMRTTDGTDHIFHSISYVDMMRKLEETAC